MQSKQLIPLGIFGRVLKERFENQETVVLRVSAIYRVRRFHAHSLSQQGLIQLWDYAISLDEGEDGTDIQLEWQGNAYRLVAPIVTRTIVLYTLRVPKRHSSLTTE